MDSNFRAELLNLFRNDEEFKQLFGQGGGALWEQVKALEKNYSELEKQNDSLKAQLSTANERAATAESDFKVLQSKLEDTIRAATAEKFSLQEKLTAADDRTRALEGENNSLRSQLRTVEEKARAAEERARAAEDRTRALEGEKRSLQSQLTAAEDRTRTLEGDNNYLQSQLLAANDRASKAEEENNKRLPRGWALFQKYPALSENVRRNLDIVFRRENDFAAFICGGAQEDCLDIIWNTAQNALGNNQNDAALLADIFDYCLELVNASKANPWYELLQTNVGDEFDYNKHVPTGDSAAQGRIVEVLLLGYKKISNGERIIKKSIVRVM